MVQFIGSLYFSTREQFDFFGLEPLLSEHKTSQKPKSKSVAYKIYGKLKKIHPQHLFMLFSPIFLCEIFSQRPILRKSVQTDILG